MAKLSDGSEDSNELPRWPGEKLGLPKSGEGSAASGGIRLLAFLLDLLLASLITSLFRRPEFADPASMQAYNLWAGGVWFVIAVVPVAFFGFTPAMGLLGVRVGRLDGKSMVGPVRALVRAVLTCLLIPAAIRNPDGRSWLDRLTGTVVVRLR